MNHSGMKLLTIISILAYETSPIIISHSGSPQ